MTFAITFCPVRTGSITGGSMAAITSKLVSLPIVWACMHATRLGEGHPGTEWANSRLAHTLTYGRSSLITLK
jgi:hypothetical protein